MSGKTMMKGNWKDRTEKKLGNRRRFFCRYRKYNVNRTSRERQQASEPNVFNRFIGCIEWLEHVFLEHFFRQNRRRLILSNQQSANFPKGSTDRNGHVDFSFSLLQCFSFQMKTFANSQLMVLVLSMHRIVQTEEWEWESQTQGEKVELKHLTRFQFAWMHNILPFALLLSRSRVSSLCFCFFKCVCVFFFAYSLSFFGSKSKW